MKEFHRDGVINTSLIRREEREIFVAVCRGHGFVLRGSNERRRRERRGGRECGVFEVENLVANRARQRHMSTCNRSRALNEKVGHPNAQLQLKNAKYFARVDRPVTLQRSVDGFKG